MTTPGKQEPESSHDGLIDIHEVAKLLGVSVRHVRRLVHEGRIPFIKWGHLLRFDRIEINRWIDSFRRWPEQAS